MLIPRNVWTQSTLLPIEEHIQAIERCRKEQADGGAVELKHRPVLPEALFEGIRQPLDGQEARDT